MSPDMVGGMMLLGGALFQVASIWKAYKDKAVKGVHPLSMLYFMTLNAYYAWYFGTTFSPWSMVGELALVVTYTIWLGQYIAYEKLKVGSVLSKDGGLGS